MIRRDNYGKLRISSPISFLVSNLIGIIYLENVNIINTQVGFIDNKLFIWIFTVFFGLNSIGNLLSKSKKEKMIMAPLTIMTTIASIIIAISFK